jgi:hypothetical protein
MKIKLKAKFNNIDTFIKYCSQLNFNNNMTKKKKSKFD